MSLSITTRTLPPDITVVELEGRITLGKDSSQIESIVLGVLGDGAKKLVIDLSKVAYVDSNGIGIVTYCFAKANQAGAKMAVAGARALVMEVFRVTQVDTVIDFFPDVETAAAALGSPEAAA